MLCTSFVLTMCFPSPSLPLQTLPILQGHAQGHLLHTAVLNSTRLFQAHSSLNGHATPAGACTPASTALFHGYFIFMTRLQVSKRAGELLLFTLGALPQYKAHTAFSNKYLRKKGRDIGKKDGSFPQALFPSRFFFP